MTRRIKRTANYGPVLEIKSDSFMQTPRIQTPRGLQRNWVPQMIVIQAVK